MANSGTASEDRSYDYDSAWNLTNRTVNTTPQTFQVDGLNQLTNSTPGGVSAYDGNGNMVSSAGGLLELTYEDENRLSTVQSNCCELFCRRKNGRTGVARFSVFRPCSDRVLWPNNRARIVVPQGGMTAWAI